MFGDVYGVIVEDMTLKKKLLRRLFGQLLEKIGLLFTSTSGHNDYDSRVALTRTLLIVRL